MKSSTLSSKCKALLATLFAILTLLIYTSAGAQSPVPSASMKGPVKGTVNGDHLFITAQVKAGNNPAITFSLVNNHSGAYIVSQGTFSYDAASGLGAQVVEINPGNTKGGFTVKAAVANNTNEKAECGLSVAVN